MRPPAAAHCTASESATGAPAQPGTNAAAPPWPNTPHPSAGKADTRDHGLHPGKPSRPLAMERMSPRPSPTRSCRQRQSAIQLNHYRQRPPGDLSANTTQVHAVLDSPPSPGVPCAHSHDGSRHDARPGETTPRRASPDVPDHCRARHRHKPNQPHLRRPKNPPATHAARETVHAHPNGMIELDPDSTRPALPDNCYPRLLPATRRTGHPPTGTCQPCSQQPTAAGGRVLARQVHTYRELLGHRGINELVRRFAVPRHWCERRSSHGQGCSTQRAGCHNRA